MARLSETTQSSKRGVTVSGIRGFRAATLAAALAALVIGATPAAAGTVPDAHGEAVAQFASSAARPFVAKTPVIKGAAKVGAMLTAQPGAWSPAPATFSYQWFRSGRAIAKAVGVRYVVSAADLDKRITVRVIGTKPGYRTASTMSRPTAAIVAGTFAAAPVPAVVGSAIVGHALTARPGTWKPKPVAIAYQWFRSGKVIPRATGAKYTLVAADAGATITVRVVATAPGYKTAVKMSKATAKVTAAAPPKPPAEPYYSNCTAARAAGVAPIYRGQPGYRPGLDRDNDGIACE